MCVRVCVCGERPLCFQETLIFLGKFSPGYLVLLFTAPGRSWRLPRNSFDINIDPPAMSQNLFIYDTCIFETLLHWAWAGPLLWAKTNWEDKPTSQYHFSHRLFTHFLLLGFVLFFGGEFWGRCDIKCNIILSLGRQQQLFLSGGDSLAPMKRLKQCSLAAVAELLCVQGQKFPEGRAQSVSWPPTLPKSKFFFFFSGGGEDRGGGGGRGPGGGRRRAWGGCGAAIFQDAAMRCVTSKPIIIQRGPHPQPMKSQPTPRQHFLSWPFNSWAALLFNIHSPNTQISHKSQINNLP